MYKVMVPCAIKKQKNHEPSTSSPPHKESSHLQHGGRISPVYEELHPKYKTIQQLPEFATMRPARCSTTNIYPSQSYTNSSNVNNNAANKMVRSPRSNSSSDYHAVVKILNDRISAGVDKHGEFKLHYYYLRNADKHYRLTENRLVELGCVSCKKFKKIKKVLNAENIPYRVDVYADRTSEISITGRNLLALAKCINVEMGKAFDRSLFEHACIVEYTLSLV